MRALLVVIGTLGFGLVIAPLPTELGWLIIVCSLVGLVVTVWWPERLGDSTVPVRMEFGRASPQDIFPDAIDALFNVRLCNEGFDVLHLTEFHIEVVGPRRLLAPFGRPRFKFALPFRLELSADESPFCSFHLEEQLPAESLPVSREVRILVTAIFGEKSRWVSGELRAVVKPPAGFTPAQL